jgi:nitric oxide reductase subunit B
MLISTATLFTVGVGLFIFDFFRYHPRLDVITERDPPTTPVPAERSA